MLCALHGLFRFQRPRMRMALGLSSTRLAITGAMLAVQRFGCAGAKPVRLQDCRPFVPPPRMHMMHFYGVLAPNAKLRNFVVPEAPAEGGSDPCGHSIACEQLTTGKTIRWRWIPWATMLQKVFAVDVLACPNGQGRMQRIAWITQPRIIHAILACVEVKPQPP